MTPTHMTWPANAFREKFGSKRQIFQLRRQGLSEAKHEQVATAVLKKLNLGQDPQEVETWARAQYL